LFLLSCFLWPPGEAFSSAPNFSFDIHSHRLKVEIEPSRHHLKAEDRIEIHLQDREKRTLSLLLHPKLKVLRIVDLRTGEPIRWDEAPSSSHGKRVDLALRKGERTLSLALFYEGQIYDPVAKSTDLQFVRGDQTTGLIGPEGVYLSSTSHWYPDRPGSMAKFEVEATIPDPFRIVTQGENLFEELKSGLWRGKWSYSLPTESLTLVAGQYSVRGRTIDGIKISTYFFPQDDKLSEAFLDAAADYLKIYPGLLGPYPYKKFDIVQNFFSSGYGIPTFTLLAPDAIRQGKEFLRPGALDHEIVHSWWGHYVSLKPGTGNWVEALTSYCTNYYYKELKVGEEEARKHRQDAMQKYAIQVDPSKDYPLRRFEGKDDEIDGQIGYGKGSMVFHLLRQAVGKDAFFSTLREFSKRFGGKQAAWRDIQQIFEEASGKSLGWFFSQWLDRPGGPRLKLEQVAYEATSEGYRISGEVVQEGDIYRLSLPVEVDLGNEKKELLLEVSKRREPFSIEVPTTAGTLRTLTIDPQSHVFRRLYPEEIIPGFNVLLEDRDKVFVIPGQKREDRESGRIYAELAHRATERKGGRVLSEEEVTEEDVKTSSLVLLGESWKNPLFSRLITNLSPPVQLNEGTWLVSGEKVDKQDVSLLLTHPHPFRPGKWVTLYFGFSANSLSRARFIFYYGWESYILFKMGRPLVRGSFPPKASYLTHPFPAEGRSGKVDLQRLKDHLSFLSSRELAGRFPGTPGYHQVQAYLQSQLEEMGIQPVLQPFSYAVRDVEGVRVSLMGPAGAEDFKAIPVIFSTEGKWEGPCFVDDGTREVSPADLRGRAVLVTGCGQCPEGDGEEVLLTKIADLQSKGASAILFLLENEELNRISPYVTYPSHFPPKLEERLKQRASEGYSIQRWMEASKVVEMGKTLSFPVRITVLILPYARTDEERIRSLTGAEEISVGLSVQFRELTIRDSNIGGLIPGNDPEKKESLLVLGAHYDHLGMDEKTGEHYPGADDNGSGVAALLEIGRHLNQKRGELKRSLLILFFGGEEWGLRGSRFFIRNPFVPFAHIKAMLSLDSIGGATGEKELFLIGGSIHSLLAGRSRRFLSSVGLKEGRNIDRYAFAFGSDHYPFHQAGIPSLDYFASDHKKIHTFRDNVEAIDLEKLAAVTRLVYLTAHEFLTEP
jgi:aminopeptidase N